MKTLCFCFLFLFVKDCDCYSQLLKNVHFNVEGGVAISVGPSVVDHVTTSNGLFTVYYYSSERYKYPLLRTRFSALKQVGSKLYLGFRTGADVVYFELDGQGNKVTYFAFPIQFVSQFKLFELSASRALMVNAGLGFKTRKQYVGGIIRNGGLLASTEVILNGTPIRNSFSYKLGFEYCIENSSYEAIPPPNNVGLKAETLHLKTSRKLVFISFGYNF
jgi:hypothetical protein